VTRRGGMDSNNNNNNNNANLLSGGNDDERHVIGFDEQHRSHSLDDISQHRGDALSRQMRQRRRRLSADNHHFADFDFDAGHPLHHQQQQPDQPDNTSSSISTASGPALVVPQFNASADSGSSSLLPAIGRFLTEHQNHHRTVCIQVHGRRSPVLAAALVGLLEQGDYEFQAEEHPERVMFYVQNKKKKNNNNNSSRKQQQWIQQEQQQQQQGLPEINPNHQFDEEGAADETDPALQLAMRISAQEFLLQQQQENDGTDETLEYAMRLSTEDVGVVAAAAAAAASEHDEDDYDDEQSLDIVQELQQMQSDEDIALRLAQYGSVIFKDKDVTGLQQQQGSYNNNNHNNHSSTAAVAGTGYTETDDETLALRLARNPSNRALLGEPTTRTAPQQQQQQREKDELAALHARKEELRRKIQEQEDFELALRLARQGSQAVLLGGGSSSSPQDSSVASSVSSLSHWVRGIPNTTGTACHILSPLALLFYSVPAIREILLELATLDHQGAHPLLRELALLFRQVNNQIRGSGSNTIDPRPMYQAFLNHLGIEARMLGDATTALSKLIHELRQSILSKVIEATMGTGRVSTKLEGISPHRRRIKNGKQRSLAVPFSLPVDDLQETSLEDCLTAYFQPTEIENYTWTEGTYEEHDLEGFEDGPPCEVILEEWITTKTSTLEELPGVWILHLDRFTFEHGRVQPKPTKVDIPFGLDCNHLFPSLANDAASYHLTGAILHVNTEGELEEGGHYITLIPSPKTAEQQGQQQAKLWYLLDDDQVTPVTMDEARALMAGGVGENSEQSGRAVGQCESAEMRAVVLVYESCGNAAQQDAVLRKAKVELAEYLAAQEEKAINTTTDLVGRRLRIKWSKDRYFAGVITHYDDSNGKHTVLYDDGDVRTYTLSKKTIEWEEP